MQFTLSESIQVKQKVKTDRGWRVVKEVTDKGVIVKEGFIPFGSILFGWKAN